MFFTRRKPDHVTRSNVLDWAPPMLYPAVASGHDQGLAQRVGVPCGPSAGFERDTGTDRMCRIGCLEQGVNAYCAGKILGRSFAGWLRAISFDVHFLNSSPLLEKQRSMFSVQSKGLLKNIFPRYW